MESTVPSELMMPVNMLAHPLVSGERVVSEIFALEETEGAALGDDGQGPIGKRREPSGSYRLRCAEQHHLVDEIRIDERRRHMRPALGQHPAAPPLRLRRQ